MDDPIQDRHRRRPFVGRSEIRVQIANQKNDVVAEILLDGSEIEVYLTQGYTSLCQWSDPDEEDNSLPEDYWESAQ